MKQRAKKTIRGIVVILLIGLVYAAWCLTTHIYIPCIFRSITGLKCPGCGVTGMMVSLLHFDFAEAWKCNAALMILSPYAIFFVIRRIILYIKYDSQPYKRWENISVWVCISGLLIFAVLRNVFTL